MIDCTVPRARQLMLSSHPMTLQPVMTGAVWPQGNFAGPAPAPA